MVRVLGIKGLHSHFVRANFVQAGKHKKNPILSGEDWVLFGAPAENRTPDTLIKSQVLYQLSYRGIFCAVL